MSIDLNETFKPDPNMKNYYRVYVGLFMLLPILISTLFFLTNPAKTAALGTGITWLIFLPITIFTSYWIPKYYSSVSYTLTEDRVIVKKGVWFQKSQNVPYRLIMNITVKHGPIYRYFGLGKVQIETAGHSGQNSEPEAQIFCVRNYEEIKEAILSEVKDRESGAYPTTSSKGKETGLQPEILKELKNIRKNLE